MKKNSLWFADSIETIPDNKNIYQNLNLTYGVRDGLICHCGEIDDNALFPRTRYIDLKTLSKPAQVQPFTWEGCVVKIADKIAYLGRDVEDAFTLKIFSPTVFYLNIKRNFPDFSRTKFGSPKSQINNTILIHSFITDLVKMSNPEKGLRFSEWHLDFMKVLRRVSSDLIYKSPRLKYSADRAKLVIESIFDVLNKTYRPDFVIIKENQNDFEFGITQLTPYPLLNENFSRWLVKYSNINKTLKLKMKYANKVIYNINDQNQYNKMIIDFIAAMTDNFALRIFNELTRFG